MIRAAAATIAGLLLSGPTQAMTASFSWNGIPACAKISPAFSIHGAPKGTTALRFLMRDYDAPNFQHGGSTVPFTGPRVAKGAITYVGPCPPSGETHRYTWRIEALDASGATLMAITTEGAYPPD